MSAAVNLKGDWALAALMNQNTTEDVTDEKKNDIIVNNSAEAIIEDEVASKVDTDFNP